MIRRDFFQRAFEKNLTESLQVRLFGSLTALPICAQDWL